MPRKGSNEACVCLPPAGVAEYNHDIRHIQISLRFQLRSFRSDLVRHRHRHCDSSRLLLLALAESQTKAPNDNSLQTTDLDNHRIVHLHDSARDCPVCSLPNDAHPGYNESSETRRKRLCLWLERGQWSGTLLENDHFGFYPCHSCLYLPVGIQIAHKIPRNVILMDQSS